MHRPKWSTVAIGLALIAAVAVAVPASGLSRSIKKAIKKEVSKQVSSATGPQGAQGAPGPGAISFDRQFPVDSAFHQVTTVNGLVLNVGCDIGMTNAVVVITNVAHGWGIEDRGGPGGTLESALVNNMANTMSSADANFASLDVVATSTSPVEPGKYTRIDANVIRGTACNFHGMVIPSASVG